MLPLRKIRALLVEHEIRVKEIARRANVSPVTVSIILTGKGKSKNIQRTISTALRVSYEVLWGDEETQDKVA